MMVILYFAAASLGALAGASFALIWLRIVPMSAHTTFWVTIGSLSRKLLIIDESADVLAFYQRLGIAVSVYTFRNLAGVLISGLPLIFVLITVAPNLIGASDAHADRVVVVPIQAGIVIKSGAENGGTRFT